MCKAKLITILPTITCTPSTRSITYSSKDLREINITIKPDKDCNILPLGAINTIGKFKINKKRISILSRMKSSRGIKYKYWVDLVHLEAFEYPGIG